MPGFKSSNTNLDNIFLSDYSVLDRASGSGTLWGWGLNEYGGVGDGTTTSRSSPTRTQGGTNFDLSWDSVSTWQGISAGIQTDGKLYCWGRNDVGQLGDNTTINRSSPVQTVSGGNNWRQVSIAYEGSHAIKKDGTLWGWGWNSEGQLGDGTTVNKSSPVQVLGGGTNWKQVTHLTAATIALKTDGTLWGWGLNSFSVLGDNSAISRSSPVQTVAGGTNWKSINIYGTGDKHTVALKTDGTMWGWGSNESQFRVGDGSTVSGRSSPVQIFSTGSGWRQVSHSSHTLAIKFDGSLWGWGLNSSGQLGDGTTVLRSSIVQTVAGGYDWKQCVAGPSGSIALKKDGTLWHWGSTPSGSTSSPVQFVSGSSNWKQVSGYHSTAALGVYFLASNSSGTPGPAS